MKFAIQPFTADDIPEVADLYLRNFQEQTHSTERLHQYYRDVLLDGPWVDPALPSLLCRTDTGRLVGFVGVVAREMRFRGRPIRVAAATQLSVDPVARSGLAGLSLVRKLFSGPQHLTIADNAGDMGRLVVEGIGGRTDFSQSLRWIRMLRPLRYLLHRFRDHAPTVARGAAPLMRFLDWVLARSPRSALALRSPQTTCRPIDAQTIACELPRLRKTDLLIPNYDAAVLDRQLALMACDRSRGTFACRGIHDPSGTLLGWYVVYFVRHGVTNVVQLAARPGDLPRVLDRLYYDARRWGSLAVYGRVAPAAMTALAESKCVVFRREGPWMLLHARDPKIIDTIERGRAFLSRLDGEWWINFSSVCD